ncbi:histidine phosphatase family protein [Pantoea sp. Bo_2]|uniref:Histidine phosphatase family protein n=1 Tax=Candidatus Pantoea gossypiicola TaxID=2608008 RepID=A0AB34CKE4_9GAMM|nr:MULTISPECIES: histidine phosphatase family protein [Pantoea]KAA5931050.1 histidine phosphatase family protein [Pantoea sp. VH_8]KAA5935717.1 histidine phosphatase family protein [Pantoea sp. VH_4]KAA5948834.1 histidine phosphatase family protein [Pantoea sp. VH_3]KAA5950649.1 histidine phosphatase family protein [Pantoea sp. VH_24]KAA5955217.1 histidine phosphatase family protein [Pantoea sp. VH_25]
MKKANFLLICLIFLFSPLANATDVYIYLVRHGQTLFNLTGQVQGWSDSPLTEKGISQATRAGKGLSNVDFKTAFSSDAGRARATARIILAENKSPSKPDVTELTELREWGYGGFEGRDDAELWQPLFAAKHVEFKKDWSTWENFTARMSDKEIADAIAHNDKTGMAENYAQITARLREGIEKIVKETAEKGGGNSLVISHGSAIPTLLSLFTPEQYHGESIGNVSLTILHYHDGIFTIKTLGDTHYMHD